MGLDHWLTGEQYISSYDHNPKEVELQKTLAGVLSDYNGKNNCHQFPNPDPFPVNTVEYQIIQWRKANQIHSWFVENVQSGKDDCGRYYVSTKQLRDLLDLCNEVKAHWGNPEKVRATLPPANGFFFGSQDINEWYKEDIENTIEALQKVFDGNFNHLEFYYGSSW